MSITNPKRGSNKGILAAHRANKRDEAQIRQNSRNNRTNDEQIELLNTRPGNSKKERSRLLVSKVA